MIEFVVLYLGLAVGTASRSRSRIRDASPCRPTTRGGSTSCAPSSSPPAAAALRVPLVVWHPGAEPPPEVAAWGETVDVSSHAKIDGALRDLKRRLGRQAVVWLDGFHLPQDVRLKAGVAEGVRMVR